MKKLKYSNKNLFFNMVKRFRPMLVLFSIVLAMCIPVVIMLAFNGQNPEQSYTAYQNFLDLSNDVGHVMGRVLVCISAVFGLFAGCSVMRYQMNRQSAVLFASLPVRREKQLAIQFGAGLVCYGLSLALTLILTFAVYLINGVHGNCGGVFVAVPAAIVWFLFFYALTMFIGSLCGMTSIQFLLTAVVIFYLPATLSLIIVLIDDVFYSFINVEAYISADIMQYLSPAIYLGARVIKSLVNFYDGTDGIPELYRGTLSFALAAVVLLALTVLILKRRSHEKAGGPILFGVVNSIVKYAVMVPCALLLGLIFYVTGSRVSMVVGMALGAVLSFMLMNVILAKNARAYFTGIKGFAVFVVSFAVCFTMLAVDPLNVDTYIPGEDAVKSVTLNVHGEQVTFTDKDEIRALNRIVEAAQNGDTYGSGEQVEYIVDSAVQYSSYFDYGWSSYGTYIYVDYETNLGIRIKKSLYLMDCRLVKDEFMMLYSSQAMRDTFFGRIEEVAEEMGQLNTPDITYYGPAGNQYQFQSITIDSNRKEELLQMLKDMEEPLYSAINGPEVMTISWNGTNIPIYYSGEYADILDFITEASVSSYTYVLPTEETLDKYLSAITTVKVYSDGDYTEYDDRDKIRELYLNSIGFYSAHDVFAGGDYVEFIAINGTIYTSQLYD